MLRVGDVVRKKGPMGKPIGPYMIVTQHSRFDIHVVMYKSIVEMTLKRKDVVYTKCARVLLTEEKIEKLFEKQEFEISHPATGKLWLGMLKNKPEILIIKGYFFGSHAYAHVDEVLSVWLGGVRYIKLKLSKI